MNPDSPRVGNISSSNGVSMAVFSAEEVSKLATPFQHTLVGKFSFGRPSLGAIRQHLVNFGCTSIRVQLLNQRHVLIFLAKPDDFTMLWLKREIFIENLPMRMFKWSPAFDVKHEPSVAPVWVKLSGLPLHLFDKHALFTIGKLIGDPLKIDEATKTLSRVSFARICVEADLKQAPPTEICILNAGDLLTIPVVYEWLPQFCAHCHYLGHEESSCYIKKPGPRPRRNLEKFAPKPSKGKEKVISPIQPGPSEFRTEEMFQAPEPVQVNNPFDALVPYEGPAGNNEENVYPASGYNSEDSAGNYESDSVGKDSHEDDDDVGELDGAESVHSSPSRKLPREDHTLPRNIASTPASPVARKEPSIDTPKPTTAPKKSRMQKEIEALLQSQHGKKKVVSRTRKK
ncbi:hypothetical protein CDL12_15065 [Handroanthus impetiginosus]|uniref:DUF4283 domain-containing protein n=1 Tax=Handroanthus impetiginosus TaxID=429701 RepID=A0A2G9H494_9LAMI|nr:hypothetical protein CDL12_15065 [Handroanthus impetiginosus]